MSSISTVYTGSKKSSATHADSGITIDTDAPKEVGGGGTTYSPSDLLGAALGTCIASTLGMFAERHEIDLTGLKVDVVKTMSTNTPRRVESLMTTVTVPGDRIPVDQRELYERVGHSCPVHKSLHPDVQAPIQFIYED